MNKIVTILVAAMFFLVSATYSQTSLTISPTTVTGNTGETVTVSMIVNDFDDIVSMQYSIRWDPTVIRFDTVANFNLKLKDLNTGKFNVNDSDNGFYTLAWFDPDVSGITLEDGEVIYTMSFTVLGDASSGSTIIFDSSPTSIEVINGSDEDLTDSVIFTEAQFGDPAGNNTGNNNGNTAPLISTISNESGDNGTTVCVDVRVANFTNITAMDYSLNWDASILEFDEIRNINLTGLSQSSFGTSTTSNGRLSVNWANAAGATVSNRNIYQACFNLIGEAGTNSAVTFASTPTPINVTTTASTTSVGITQTNGSVRVNNSSINPPPTSNDGLLNANSVTAESGSVVCVPVTVNDFDNLAGLQFSMNWDETALAFTEIKNINLKDLSGADFITTDAANGGIRVLWTEESTNGISVADGTVIFELCFTVLGASGTNTTLSFTDNPVPQLAIMPNSETAFQGTEGVITVQGGTAPPTSSSDDGLLNVNSVTAESGSVVCVPITVNDFDNLAGLQFSMNWDATALAFTEIKNINLKDLSGADFITTDAANGGIRVLWTEESTNGISVADGTVIFELCFNVLGANGTNGTLSFSDNPVPQLAITTDSETAFEGTEGVITIEEETVTPPPTSNDGLLNANSVTAESGSIVCVPVTVNDFDNLAGLQFSMNWDETALAFTEVKNINLKDLSAADFITTDVADGIIRTLWTEQSTNGISVADGTVIFELCFTVLGTNGTNTTLSFSDNPVPQLAITASSETAFQGTAGVITIEGGIVNPPTPNDGLLNANSVTAESGSVVCVPVTVNDFDNLAGLQFSMNWDETALAFTEVKNINLKDLSMADFITTDVADGIIRTLWTEQSTNGISVADGTVIFELCFTVLGANGTNTTLSFSDNPVPQLAITTNSETAFQGTSGVITIEGGIVNPPNPDDGLLNANSVTAESGSVVCVPVTVNDFDNLAGLQFSMNWDETALAFTEVKNINLKDLSMADFITTDVADGIIRTLWTEQSTAGISVADGTVIFELCFTVLGANGTNTTLSFSDNPVPQLAITTNDETAFQGTSGTITIEEDGGDDCLSAITAAATPTNVSCNGLSDGAITLSVSGGDGTYTYQWSDASIGNIPNPTGLPAGVYNVTISSCGGQEMKTDIPAASLTITEPTAIVSVITPEDVSCFGEADGRINVSVSGGSAPYTYQWSDASLAPPNRPVNAAVGTYSLTITDASNCTNSMDGITVDGPAEIIANVTTTAASCTGIGDGSATVTVTGGSGTGYTYNWSLAGVTGASPTNLPGGDYTVTISDDTQCSIVLPVTISNTILLSANVQVVEDACGDNSGAILVTPSGGIAPYAYEWSGPATIGDTNTADNLPTGDYRAIITDANGCFFVEDISVGGPTVVLSASGTVTDVDCAGEDNGMIDLSVAGGFEPYTFVWTNGATTQNISNLTAGEYTVTVTDSKICTSTQNFVVETRSNMMVSIEITKGAPDAEATATVTGGVAPYTYEWCNGQTGESATGLDEGNCSLTVIDALGCPIVQNIEIIVDNPIATISATTPISCNGLTDGALQVNVTGGKPNYTYAWSNGATTSAITGVGAGNYSVTVTDTEGNEGIVSFDFVSPPALIIDLSEPTVPSCDNDGKISISISGGTMPYKETKWSNDVLGLLNEGLRAGEYGVIVTDQNDCTAEENFRITNDEGCVPCYMSNKVMTPNDDGRNDAFCISCADMAKNNHLEIYNRWGQLIFEADDYDCVLGTESDCWKGLTRTNNLVDEGGYFWILEFDDTNGRRQIKDHVTILREN